LRDGDRVDAWEPVIEITGPYRLFAHLESVYLGVLARRSLVASNVRRVVDAAGGKPVLFFADRFDHWATQGGDGYAAFVGGAEGFGERVWGVRLDTSGTMVDRSLWSEMGDFVPTGVNRRLVEKVRHALDEEGFSHVRVIVSGGFNAERIAAFEATEVPVDS